MTVGIKASKKKNIFEATLMEQSINSDKNILKIIQEGFVTRSTDGTERIVHGLGFTPGFLGFFEINGNGRWYPVYTTVQQPLTFNYVNIWSDPTYLTVEIGIDDATVINVKYFLLTDVAQ